MAIKVPAGVTRPTTDFVRQALFSILGGRVDGARVLDLFAGSGAIGLEALSRGAKSCRFVDENRQVCLVIEENLTKTRLPGGSVCRSEVLSFLKRDAAEYDLIFADPPYWKQHGDKDHVAMLLGSGCLEQRLAAEGWFVAEVSSQRTPPTAEGLVLRDHRVYGGSAILFYAREGH